MAGRRILQLDRVRRGFNDGFHGPRGALDARKEALLIEKSRVDGNIEAAAGFGIEETVEAAGLISGGSTKIPPGASA